MARTYLFVHQNFPGQFLHLAPALAARGHTVAGLTAEGNSRPSPVPVLRYRKPAAAGAEGKATMTMGGSLSLFHTLLMPPAPSTLASSAY